MQVRVHDVFLDEGWRSKGTDRRLFHDLPSRTPCIYYHRLRIPPAILTSKPHTYSEIVFYLTSSPKFKNCTEVVAAVTAIMPQLLALEVILGAARMAGDTFIAFAFYEETRIDFYLGRSHLFSHPWRFIKCS